MSRGRAALAALLLALLAACSPTERAGTPAEASTAAVTPLAEAGGHVGAAACGQCHAREYEAWRGSQHDLAMRQAGADSVLGDFAQAEFEYAGTTSVFHRRDGRYFVTTDGADGRLAEFEIRYTFGVYPLQQYLIELPGGRLQALGIAWDSRPEAQGGQRWFHLYPGQSVTAGHPLHWTGRNQNWNYMCAECHVTGLVKGYQAASDSYRTRWAELGVACEGCHGPGRAHAEWAGRSDRESARAADPALGLKVTFDERRGIHWQAVPETGNAMRSAQRHTRLEIDGCGRCHGRASRLPGDAVHAGSLLDSHRPALLDADQYWPDGQMRGEVFNWGTFLQSRMQAAGVTCSDCHEPHSAKLRRPGNALCAQCHQPERYDRASHSHHAADGPGSQCVSCHMPVTTFMQVDRRHDHGFRIPRPDLSAELGVPNACTGCHGDRTAEWAASRVAEWFPRRKEWPRDFARALQGATTGAPGTREDLARLISDAGQPAIVRASALRALAPWLDPAALPMVATSLRDPDPLIRLASAETAAQLPAPMQAQLLGDLLKDPVQAVRIEAAAALAGAGEQALRGNQEADFAAALDEYVASLQLNAERPEAMVSLGNLQRRRGDVATAAADYRRALDLDPGFVGAYVNLADLERARGAEDEAAALLRAGLERVPEAAELHHALGLALVRQGRRDEAEAQLRQAAELDPEVARYGYVLAVALHDWSRGEQAREVLTHALQRHPWNRDLLAASAIYELEAGRRQAAQALVQRLRQVDPDGAATRQLQQQVTAGGMRQ